MRRSNCARPAMRFDDDSDEEPQPIFPPWPDNPCHPLRLRGRIHRHPLRSPPSPASAGSDSPASVASNVSSIPSPVCVSNPSTPTPPSPASAGSVQAENEKEHAFNRMQPASPDVVRAGLERTKYRTREIPKEVKTECAWCGKFANRQCCGCKIARYCNTECQTKDFKTGGHKRLCRDIYDRVMCSPSPSGDGRQNARDKKYCTLAKANAEAALVKAIQTRLASLLVEVDGKHFYVTRPGLAPSGECTVIAGAISGPVKVTVGLDDGSTRTLTLTAIPGVRPVQTVFGNGESKIFKTQADCGRWLHLLGKAHQRKIAFSFREFIALYLDTAHDSDIDLK